MCCFKKRKERCVFYLNFLAFVFFGFFISPVVNASKINNLQANVNEMFEVKNVQSFGQQELTIEELQENAPVLRSENFVLRQATEEDILGFASRIFYADAYGWKVSSGNSVFDELCRRSHCEEDYKKAVDEYYNYIKKHLNNNKEKVVYAVFDSKGELSGLVCFFIKDFMLSKVFGKAVEVKFLYTRNWCEKSDCLTEEIAPVFVNLLSRVKGVGAFFLLRRFSKDDGKRCEEILTKADKAVECELLKQFPKAEIFRWLWGEAASNTLAFFQFSPGRFENFKHIMPIRKEPALRTFYNGVVVLDKALIELVRLMNLKQAHQTFFSGRLAKLELGASLLNEIKLFKAGKGCGQKILQELEKIMK